MVGGVDMSAPLLITLAELAATKAGHCMTVPKGAIITPAARDYASEQGICIVSEEGLVIVQGRLVAHEDDANRIVRSILRELQRELGRTPTREEATGFVRVVIERARQATLGVIDN